MGSDALGYRRLFGVMGPSTNTIVQPDFDDLRPVGVTNHYSRIFTPNSKAISNETFLAGTHKIAAGVIDAVRSVMTCEPDYLVMGMSAVTFYGGAAGADEFQRSIEKEAGIGVSTGSHACTAALRAYGGVKQEATDPPIPQTWVVGDVDHCVKELTAFVKEYGITHVVLGRTRRPWYRRWFGLSPLDRLLATVPGIDVTVAELS